MHTLANQQQISSASTGRSQSHLCYSPDLPTSPVIRSYAHTQLPKNSCNEPSFAELNLLAENSWGHWYHTTWNHGVCGWEQVVWTDGQMCGSSALIWKLAWPAGQLVFQTIWTALVLDWHAEFWITSTQSAHFTPSVQHSGECGCSFHPAAVFLKFTRTRNNQSLYRIFKWYIYTHTHTQSLTLTLCIHVCVCEHMRVCMCMPACAWVVFVFVTNGAL